MTDRDKLIELLRKAKSSMWGQSGLSCELARNSYIAEYLLANGVRLEEKQATSDKTSDKNKRLTNGDIIRAMSDEELAEGLEDWQDWGGGLSKEMWLEWLKESAER